MPSWITSRLSGFSQNEIPKVFSNIGFENGKYYYTHKGEKYFAQKYDSKLNLKNIIGNPIGDSSGISFDFNDLELKGTIYFGLINYNDSKHPVPVYFKRTAKIKEGKSYINIKKHLSGIYDMTSWEKTGKGTIKKIFQKSPAETSLTPALIPIQPNSKRPDDVVPEPI